MSAIQISTTETSNYALRVDERFDYPATDTITLLDAVPSASEIMTVDSKTTNGDTFIFETTLSSETYLSNAIKFRFDIPIDVELENASTNDITKDNFLKEVFNNCADICVSQYGMLQGLQRCSVSLNGKVISNPTQISEDVNILSQYYPANAVAEWFPASTQDMFQSFDQYSGNHKFVKFYDEDGEEAYTNVSPEQDNNIFGCKYTKGFMSRTPVFKFVQTGVNTKKNCKLRATFFCYLPLSIGSVPDKITSLVGVNHLRVHMDLKNGVMGHLFNLTTAGAALIKSIDVDRSPATMTRASMTLQLWASPNGIPLPRTETGLLKPYSIQFPNIQTNISNSINGVRSNIDTTFNSSDIQTNSLPKAIYIAVVRKKQGGFKELAQTPISYGLIKNLELNVSSLKTTYSGISQLSYLADTNGYDAFTDTLGRLTKGFAVKIDLTKDLSLNGTTCVGASGIFRLSVRGTFINQGENPADYELYILSSLASSLDYDGASFDTTSGVLIDASKLMDSEFMRSMQYNYGRRMDVLGGGLWNTIKKGAVGAVKSIWNNRENIAKVIGDASKLARTMYGGERNYSNISGAGQTQLLGGGATSTTNFFPKGAGKSADIFKRK